MSIRFIYGRAGSGKSSYCLQDIKEKYNNGARKLVLIVPEQYSLQAERSLIEALGKKGIIGAEVLSFRRLAYRVFSEVGGLNFPHIDAPAKSMILSRILSSSGSSLKVFGKAVSQKGFVNTLTSIISEFKRYGVSPADLEELSQNISENELLKGKLTELGSIYKSYESAISDRFRDTDDDLTLLARKLDRSEAFNGAEIWIDEFSGFTPQEYSVIYKLMKKADRVNFCLCTDCLYTERAYSPTDIFFPVQSAARKLAKMAEEAGITIEAPVAMNSKTINRFALSPELAHLEKSLQEFGCSRYIGETKDISLFTAVNIYSEIEEAAREIIRLCRDEGLRCRDITVVCGNLDAYGRQISAIFSGYGIPHFIDTKVSISVNPLVKLIMAVFDLLTGNWSYEAVTRYLKTGLTGISRSETDILENYILACGIRGSHWTQAGDWNFRTELTLGEEEDEDSGSLAEVNLIRRKVSGPLLAFRSRTKGKRKAVEICTALYDLLEELGVPERVRQMTEAFKETGELSLAGEYSQVWDAVMGVLDSAVEVFGDEYTSLEKFGEILGVGFNECSIGLIPPSLDQVLVGSVNRSKNHAVKILFVLGANDGSFPAPNIHEGILSDMDRETLKNYGLELSSDTRSRAFEDQFLVYSTLTTAACSLKLSYPIADHEGKTLRPSIVISLLRRIFPGLHEYSNIVEVNSDIENLKLVASPVPTFEKLSTAIRSAADNKQISGLWLDVLSWYKSRSEWGQKCRSIVTALSYTNKAGNVDPVKLRGLYGNPVYASVSQFEKYTSCPFSYFLQYGLRAKERRIFSYTPPDVGTFLHAVIERFSEAVAQSDKSWRELDRDWCDSRISDIADELLDKMRGTAMNSTGRFRSLAGRLKRVLSRTVWLIVEHIKRSSFEPVSYETVFGSGGDFPPIVLETESGDRICLHGRVDRIDALRSENGTFLRIIDYKSGSKAFKLSDVYYGLQIQLVTYLDAIAQSGGMGLEKPILPGGMFYMKIDDPMIRTKAGATNEEIEKAIMKKMKMQGLVLADVKLIRQMDNQIDGDSLIIPARINKGDVLGRASAATKMQFEALRKYTRRLLQGIGGEMLNGSFAISPYKKKNINSCMYCSYSSVCQFDPVLGKDRYRIISDRDDEEIWAEICGAGQDKGELQSSQNAADLQNIRDSVGLQNSQDTEGIGNRQNAADLPNRQGGGSE